MGRFKQRMYRFMYGRYGADELYNFLTYLNIILILADMIVMAFLPEGIARAITSIIFSITIVLIFVWEIFRMMSRNIQKRRRENESYLQIKRAAARFFSRNTSKKTKTHNRDSEYYIFRDCTWCSCTLRLQRRMGRHRVNCPRCSRSFYVRAKKFKQKKIK